LALAVESSGWAWFALLVDGSVGQRVLDWFLFWQRVLGFHSDWFAARAREAHSLGWDFPLEGISSREEGISSASRSGSCGVLARGLSGVGQQQQVCAAARWRGVAGGAGRLSQGQTGMVCPEKPTSNVEGDKTWQRLVAGEVLGPSVLPRQVAKSMRVEGQIFIALFLPSLVRLWKYPLAKTVWLAGCSGGERPGAGAEGECWKGCDGMVLPAPVGSCGHGWWSAPVLRAKAQSCGPGRRVDRLHRTQAAADKGAARVGRVPAVCV